MPNKYQVEANEIIGRPLKTEFWHHEAAKRIVETHEKLSSFGIEHEDACAIILAIWNAACEEYGD